MSRPTTALIFAGLVSLTIHGGLLLFFLDLGTPESEQIPIQMQYSVNSKPQAQSQAVVPIKHAQSEEPLFPGEKNLGRESLGETVMGEDLGIRVRYPRLSRILGEEGVVQIALKKTASGAFNFAIENSAADRKRLEESALTATQESLAHGDLQKFIEGRETLVIKFVFKLKDNK